jgi:hypothetical protein
MISWRRIGFETGSEGMNLSDFAIIRHGKGLFSSFFFAEKLNLQLW